MAFATDTHTVSLTMPAKPEYLVLARLALSAVARLTPLEHEQVADLKLAVTEAREGEVTSEIAYAFAIEEDRLVLEIRGRERPTLSEEERQLGRAIIEAMVDENTFDTGLVRLVKNLPPADQ
jgi:hypothetical protein